MTQSAIGHPEAFVPFKRYMQPFMGFTQETDKLTGTEIFWRGLRHDSDPDTVIATPKEWDANPVAVAAFIHRNCAPDAILIMWGYSFGGMTAVNVAEELKKLGRRVWLLALCDAVYRDNAFIRWGRSLLNKVGFAPKIKIPANVENVVWSRQKVNKPQGHDIYAEDPNVTTIAKVDIRPFCHQDMDDDLEFHENVRRKIRSVGLEQTAMPTEPPSNPDQ